MQNRFKVCVSTIEPSLGIDTGNTTLSPKDAPQFSLSDELEESTNPLANDRNAGEKMMKINDYDARSKADKELQGKECLVKEIEQNNAINEGILAEKIISAKLRNITLPDDTLTPTNRRRRSK